MTGSRLMRASFLRPSLLALASAAMLAACGGGGGDSGGSTSTSLAITADNANAAARAGVAGMTTSGVAGTADSGLFGTAAPLAAVDVQVRRAQALAARALGRSQIAASQTVSCSVSGNMTVSFDDKNGNGAFDAVGESFSIAASNCVEEVGQLINGSVTLTLNQISSATSLTLGLNFGSFSAADTAAGYTASINGSLTATRSSGTLVTVRSDALTVGLTAGGSSHTYGVTGMLATADYNSTRISQTLSGTFSSSDFGGKSVKVSTPVAVQTLAADDYPSSGTVLVEGSTGSAVKLEAVNATQVRQSLDANGDGKFESTVVKLWSELF